MNFVTTGGFGLLMPVLSVYLHSSLGASPALIGLLFLITSVGGSASGPIGGELCDKIGRRKVLVISSFIITFGNIILAFATIAYPSFLIFGILYMALSLFRSWPRLVTETMVPDLISSERRLAIYGFLTAGSNAGWAIGALLGGLLADSPSTIFFVAALFSFPLIFISLIVKESRPEEVEEKKKAMTALEFVKDALKTMIDRVFLVFVGIAVLQSFVQGQFYQLFPIYAVEYVGITSQEMGILYSLNGVTLALFSTHVTKWVSRFNTITVYAMGAALFSIACIGVGFTPSFIGIFLFYSVIEAFGEMLSNPSRSTLLADIAPVDKRGRYMGILTLFQREISSFGPLLGGFIMELFMSQFILYWLFYAALGFILILSTIALKRLVK